MRRECNFNDIVKTRLPDKYLQMRKKNVCSVKTINVEFLAGLKRGTYQDRRAE